MFGSMKEITCILKALANERRLKILKLLFKKGPLTVGDISFEIGLSFRSTSRHLLLLERTGLLTRKQIATSVFYSIAYPKSGTFTKKILVLLKKTLV